MEKNAQNSDSAGFSYREDNHSHQRADEGDKIRFFYSSDAAGYLMIVGRESSGKLSVYYASDSEQAIAIQTGKNQVLANTFALDNFSGTETFTALFANRAFSFQEAGAALDKNNPDIKQLSFIIRKQ